MLTPLPTFSLDNVPVGGVHVPIFLEPSTGGIRHSMQPTATVLEAPKQYTADRHRANDSLGFSLSSYFL